MILEIRRRSLHNTRNSLTFANTTATVLRMGQKWDRPGASKLWCTVGVPSTEGFPSNNTSKVLELGSDSTSSRQESEPATN